MGTIVSKEGVICTLCAIAIGTVISVIFVSCISKERQNQIKYQQYLLENKDTVNLKQYMYVRPAKLDGHDYNLFENCTNPNTTDYSFQLEHRLDCKKCLEQYD